MAASGSGSRQRDRADSTRRRGIMTVAAAADGSLTEAKAVRRLLQDGAINGSRQKSLA